MHTLSKKDDDRLIGFVQECLGCDTQTSYEMLVGKLKYLIEDNSPEPCNGEKDAGWYRRSEVILDRALPPLRQAYDQVSKRERLRKSAPSRRQREVLK